MGQSRVKNTVRNSVVGIFSYLLTSVLTFVSRAVFIQHLGEQYLGISGLYSNVLAVLALSDLGVNTVMVYSLYRPIAEHDTQRISVLIRYFKWTCRHYNCRAGNSVYTTASLYRQRQHSNPARAGSLLSACTRQFGVLILGHQ